MITYINKDNATRYTQLFRKAEEALIKYYKTVPADQVKQINVGDITTLEKYFYYLPDLINVTNGSEDEYDKTAGRRYAMLPIDEEVFKIDANTRTIEVPQSFKRNGIAVQGDQVAEIIYFRINRYFDFMDLNNTQIYIQWENGKEKGVSQEWVRDIESDPDYLIFGWALCSPMTDVEGSLRFSVRFIDWNTDNEIIYSFSTLEASATINKALNLAADAFAGADINNKEINDMIIKRLKTSKVVGVDKADTPEFLLTIEDWVKQVEGASTYIVDLRDDGKYEFRVQAYSTDAGNIQYSWCRNKDGNIENIENIPVYVRVPYEADTNYVIAKQNRIYYDSDHNIISGINPGDKITQDCYELYGSCLVDKAGEYYAKVTNTLAFDSKTISSETISIPNPIPVNFDPNGGSAVLSNSNGYKVDLTTSIVNTDDPNADYSYEYQWYKDNVEIEDATGLTYTVDGSSLQSDIQGHYQLKTTAIRNNEKVDSLSNPFLVTYSADSISNITVTDQNDNIIEMVAYVGDTLKATATLTNNYQLQDYSSYSYNWRIVDKTGITIQDKIASSQTLVLTETLVGKTIVCDITNHYNGTSTLKTSDAMLIAQQ